MIHQDQKQQDVTQSGCSLYHANTPWFCAQCPLQGQWFLSANDALKLHKGMMVVNDLNPDPSQFSLPVTFKDTHCPGNPGIVRTLNLQFALELGRPVFGIIFVGGKAMPQVILG